MGPYIRKKHNEGCLRITPGWMNTANVIIKMKTWDTTSLICAVFTVILTLRLRMFSRGKFSKSAK